MRSWSTGSVKVLPATWTIRREVVGVRLVPDKLVLRPGQKHRLQMLADYNDGTSRDVTLLSVYNVNNDRSLRRSRKMGW